MQTFRKISFLALLSGFLISFSFTASGVPEGWKNDPMKQDSRYKRVRDQYNEMTLFKRDNSGSHPSYVFFASIQLTPEEIYPVKSVLDHYMGSLIPCYDFSLVHQDPSERYVMECDSSIEGETVHYIGIYRDLSYAGVFAVTENTSYEDLRSLGLDPNVLHERSLLQKKQVALPPEGTTQRTSGK